MAFNAAFGLLFVSFAFLCLQQETETAMVRFPPKMLPGVPHRAVTSSNKTQKQLPSGSKIPTVSKNLPMKANLSAKPEIIVPKTPRVTANRTIKRGKKTLPNLKTRNLAVKPPHVIVSRSVDNSKAPSAKNVVSPKQLPKANNNFVQKGPSKSTKTGPNYQPLVLDSEKRDGQTFVWIYPWLQSTQKRLAALSAPLMRTLWGAPKKEEKKDKTTRSPDPKKKVQKKSKKTVEISLDDLLANITPEEISQLLLEESKKSQHLQSSRSKSAERIQIPLATKSQKPSGKNQKNSIKGAKGKLSIEDLLAHVNSDDINLQLLEELIKMQKQWKDGSTGKTMQLLLDNIRTEDLNPIVLKEIQKKIIMRREEAKRKRIQQFPVPELINGMTYVRVTQEPNEIPVIRVKGNMTIEHASEVLKGKENVATPRRYHLDHNKVEEIYKVKRQELNPVYVRGENFATVRHIPVEMTENKEDNVTMTTEGQEAQKGLGLADKKVEDQKESTDFKEGNEESTPGTSLALDETHGESNVTQDAELRNIASQVVLKVADIIPINTENLDKPTIETQLSHEDNNTSQNSGGEGEEIAEKVVSVSNTSQAALTETGRNETALSEEAAGPQSNNGSDVLLVAGLNAADIAAEATKKHEESEVLQETGTFFNKSAIEQQAEVEGHAEVESILEGKVKDEENEIIKEREKGIRHGGIAEEAKGEKLAKERVKTLKEIKVVRIRGRGFAKEVGKGLVDGEILQKVVKINESFKSADRKAARNNETEEGMSSTTENSLQDNGINLNALREANKILQNEIIELTYRNEIKQSVQVITPAKHMGEPPKAYRPEVLHRLSTFIDPRTEEQQELRPVFKRGDTPVTPQFQAHLEEVTEEPMTTNQSPRANNSLAVTSEDGMTIESTASINETKNVEQTLKSGVIFANATQPKERVFIVYAKSVSEPAVPKGKISDQQPSESIQVEVTNAAPINLKLARESIEERKQKFKMYLEEKERLEKERQLEEEKKRQIVVIKRKQPSYNRTEPIKRSTLLTGRIKGREEDDNKAKIKFLIEIPDELLEAAGDTEDGKEENSQKQHSSHEEDHEIEDEERNEIRKKTHEEESFEAEKRANQHAEETKLANAEQNFKIQLAAEAENRHGLPLYPPAYELQNTRQQNFQSYGRHQQQKLHQLAEVHGHVNERLQHRPQQHVYYNHHAHKRPEDHPTSRNDPHHEHHRPGAEEENHQGHLFHRGQPRHHQSHLHYESQQQHHGQLHHPGHLHDEGQQWQPGHAQHQGHLQHQSHLHYEVQQQHTGHLHHRGHLHEQQHPESHPNLNSHPEALPQPNLPLQGDGHFFQQDPHALVHPVEAEPIFVEHYQQHFQQPDLAEALTQQYAERAGQQELAAARELSQQQGQNFFVNQPQGFIHDGIVPIAGY